MEDKFIGLFMETLTTYFGYSFPALLAGIVDTLTLPIRLILALFIIE